MGGQSVYDNPKRKTMRLDELKKRQDTARKSKIQTYIDGKGYAETATAKTIIVHETEGSRHSHRTKPED